MVTAMVSYLASAHWGLGMGKKDSIKEGPKAARDVEVVSVAAADITPRMALALAEPVSSPAEPAKIEPPKIELVSPEPTQPDTKTTTPAKSELASVEAPHIAPGIAELKPSLEPAPEPTGRLGPQEPTPSPEAEVASPRVSRFALLAACLALAAAFGGMVGALAAYGLAQSRPKPIITAGKLGAEEIQALKENVLQARVELAAIRVSVDASNRNASTQFAKIAERIERMERNAVEPAAKISKAMEGLERLSRTEAGAWLKDFTTGSTVPPASSSGKNSGLDGWVLRDVHRGTAFLEGRSGVMEVEQGDLVPGLGRIDAIRKQDGRWVVVTSKGTISMAPH